MPISRQAVFFTKLYKIQLWKMVFLQRKTIINTGFWQFIVKNCNNVGKFPKVFRKNADIHYISYKRCVYVEFHG